MIGELRNALSHLEIAHRMLEVAVEEGDSFEKIVLEPVAKKAMWLRDFVEKLHKAAANGTGKNETTSHGKDSV